MVRFSVYRPHYAHSFPQRKLSHSQGITTYNDKQARMESLQTSPVFLAFAFHWTGAGLQT
jgi:hypothetical protein